MSIEEFPTHELVRDYEGCQQDIRLCTLALKLGIKTFGNGRDVRWRLEQNEKIAEKIVSELERREEGSIL